MKEICSLEDLDICLAASQARPILLFKHSTACPLSALAHRRVAQAHASDSIGLDFYIVKVIESRTVSNEIESRLGVQHKSPQLILVKNCKPLWTTSHFRITVNAIKEAARSAARENSDSST